jgi:hypothetical protein
MCGNVKGEVLMKSLLAISAAALALGAAVPALAQTETMSPEATEAAGSSQLTGSAVFDSTGQQVGTIEEVSTGADGSEQAVISVGGFLGLGSKKIAVASSQLTANEDGSGYTIALTADEIEAAPEYQPQ